MAAVAGTKVGTGYVELHPDFSRFQERVGKQLNQALAPVMRKAGGSAGKDLARGIDRGGFGQMLRQRFGRIGDDAGKELAAKVSKGAKRAEGDMFGLADAVRQVERNSRKASRSSKALGGDMFGIGKAAKEAGRGIAFSRSQTDSWTRRADGAITSSKRLRDRVKGLGYEFGSLSRGVRTSSGGFSGFDGVMARVNRSSQFFRNVLRTIKWPVFIAGIGLSLQGLSALAAGAVAAASALGSLSGALVALPAAALAGAQAFGAFKLATSGVADAVKAALDVEVSGGQQAVDVLRQQKDAAERVADAKRNLIDVQGQAEKAQDDLREARESATRQLQDMRLAAEASGTSEKQAALSLREARRELARTLADPAANGLDVRGAELAVEQAKNDLESTRVEAKRARQDYRDAQKSGVDGMPEVVAAKEAEADANEAVTDAQRDLRRATEDATAAMEGQGSAATALQEKMAQLPPAGQKFVRFLVGLKPRLDALRKTAASGFFPGAEAGLKGLMGNFREVKGVVGETAGALGAIAAKAGKKLGSDVWGKDLSRLGKLNARILRRMGDAGLNLADALRHVLVAAEPFLDWLSESAVQFSEWIRGEAEAGRKSGALAEFFERTRHTMELLGPILKGVGGALLNIAEAARPLGNAILGALGDSAEGWRKWTDSTKGENTLKRYFAEVKPAVFEMGKLIGAMGKAFFTLGKQKGVAHLLRLVRTELIPALTDVTGAVTGWASEFLTEFGELRKDGVSTFDAFLRTLADHAGQAAWKIAKALVSTFLNASIWGKLAVTGWLLAKFGGLRTFAKLGVRAGGVLGRAMIGKLAPTIAAEMAAGSKLGEVLSSRMYKLGKVGGRKFAVGIAIGVATLAVWLGKEIGESIPKGTRVAIRRWGYNAGENFVNALITAINKGIRAINDSLDAVNVLGKLGVDAPEIGEIGGVNFHSQVERQREEAQRAMRQGLINGPGGSLVKPLKIPAPKTDEAEKGFARFRRQVGKEAELTRNAFKAQLQRVPDIAGSAGQGALRQMLPRLDALKVQGGNKGDAFAERVGHSFGSLARAASTAFDNIGFNVREMLRALGGKAPKFNVQKALKEMPELQPLPGNQAGGLVRAPRLRTGGLAATVPGTGTGDRHVLSLNGRPVAKVESKEGIFVGNRNLMGALHQANAEVPRFQKGGQLGAEPQIGGPAGSLRSVGQLAVKKVYEGAKDFLDKHGSVGGGIADAGPLKQFNRSYPEHMLSNVAGKARFSESLVARIARWAGLPGRTFGQVAHGESNFYPGVFGIDPGGTEGLGLWQITTGFNDARIRKWGGRKQMFNPLKNAKAAKEIYDEQGLGAWYGLDFVTGMQKGGMLQRLAGAVRGRFGGSLPALAGGGMVDPSWDPGSETINSSISQLVGEYAKRYDIDITAGYDPGGGHVSPGHNATGTATDVIPRSGNWDGAFAKGLETLAKLGFEVGYDGSIPGTESWPNHGKYNHAHIEWVGNGTAGDARQRLREFLGGVGSAGVEGTPAAAPKEEVPAVYQGAKTGQIDFGPRPKTPKEAEKQITRWQKEARVYRKARRHAEKHGKPATAQAIGQNLTKIEERLSALRSLRTQLRLKEVRERLNKRIGKAFGRFGNYEQIIEGSQLDYEEASEYAEKVVDLEPRSPELPASATDGQREAAEKAYVTQFSSYVDTRERPAFAAVLDKVAGWRNNILRAETFGFGKGSPSVAASEGQWEGEVRGARARIEKIQRFSEAVDERVAQFKRDHKGEPLPDGLKKQVAERDAMRKELPGLRLRDNRLSDAVSKARELFFPGGKNRLDELPMGKRVQVPLPGSGSFEEKLREIQGIHWPDHHELLGAGEIGGTRDPSRFGGIIWDLQETFEGLGLKIKEAVNGIAGGSSGDEGDGEREALLRDLLTQSNQEKLLRSVEARILGDHGGILPKFHSGGVVPGPVGREVPILAQAGEGVLNLKEMAALGSASAVAVAPQVQVTVYENGEVDVEIDDKKVEAIIDRRERRQARGAGRRRAGSQGRPR